MTTRIFLFYLLSVGLFSCSNKLTNSKAQKILSQCLVENPVVGKAKIPMGKSEFFIHDEKAQKRLAIMEKLEKEEYLTLKLIKFHEKSDFANGAARKIYNVSPTEKLKKYILNEHSGYISSYVMVKAFNYAINEVKEVHEIPSFNIVEVKAVLKKENKTPFFELYRDQKEIITAKLTIEKTVDGGWDGCAGNLASQLVNF